MEAEVVLASSPTDNGIGCWDLHTGAEILCHRSPALLTASSVSPAISSPLPSSEMASILLDQFSVGLGTSQGTYIAGGGVSGDVYFWEVATGKLLKKWHAHYRAVSCLVFNDDQSLLISGGYQTLATPSPGPTASSSMGWAGHHLTHDPRHHGSESVTLVTPSTTAYIAPEVLSHSECNGKAPPLSHIHNKKLVEIKGSRSHMVWNVYDFLDVHLSQCYSALVTANEAPKIEVMYYWFKKQKSLNLGSEIRGFTRVLHSGRMDESTYKIPTFVS
ncbi:Protein ROOT INITIATION DEFECTIVE 3 [Striga hermonthica]|uniref:Protein ROOT INITIATION DEFECTIVE 3 n=1 Tax=Striga hermonthica TaxID=68872 RepID=A0A9N7NAL6_STRHE|nr:Protein ROOT INITIATION DEFECTIVE 3 [Striga hermonthica]